MRSWRYGTIFATLALWGATVGKAEIVDLNVCFTPAESCEPKIVDAVNRARKEIKVQAYYFTSLPIIHALQQALARGVDVEVLLDKQNRRKYSAATLLAAKGALVMIDEEPAIAHNKLIIVDKHLVIGGSYNYTKAAEKRNAENVTFIEGATIAAKFLENWDSRFRVSVAFDAAK